MFLYLKSFKMFIFRIMMCRSVRDFTDRGARSCVTINAGNEFKQKETLPSLRMRTLTCSTKERPAGGDLFFFFFGVRDRCSIFLFIHIFSPQLEQNIKLQKTTSRIKIA